MQPLFALLDDMTMWSIIDNVTLQLPSLLAFHAFYEETCYRTVDNVADSNDWGGIDDFRTFYNNNDPEMGRLATAN